MRFFRASPPLRSFVIIQGAPTQPADPVPSILVSDADRDQACTRLRDNFAAGRLTQDEFEQRSQRALTARTAAELESVLRGLPGPDFLRREYAPQPAAAPPERVAGWVAPLMSVPAVLATVPMLLGLLPNAGATASWSTGLGSFFFFLPIAGVLWLTVWALVKHRRWAKGLAATVAILLGCSIVGLVITIPALWGLWHVKREA